MASQDVQKRFEQWQSALSEDKSAVFDELMGSDDAVALVAMFAAEYPDPESQYRVATWLRGSSVLRPSVDPRSVRTVASYYYSAVGGGIETALVALSRTFVQAGKRSIIITRDRSAVSCAPNGVTGVSLEDYGLQFDRFSAFARIMLDNQVDVLVHHAWFDVGLLWDIVLCRVLGVSIVLNTHNVFSHFLDVTNGRFYEWNDGRLFASVPRCCELCDAVVSQTSVTRFFFSHFSSRTYEVVNQMPAEYVCEAERRLALGGEWQRTGETVLRLGRFDIFKHPEDAIRILHLVSKDHPYAKLVFVGESGYETYEQELAALADELGLTDRVVFEGFQKDVRPYYESAALLLLTTEIEGYCMVLAEACAHGLPVVAYDLPYLPFSQCSGIEWVEQGDIEQAARKVGSLLANKEKRRAMSEESLRFFFEGLKSPDSWEGVIKDIERGRCCESVNDVDFRYEELWDTMLVHYLKGARRTHEELELLANAAAVAKQERDACVLALRECREEYEHSLSYRLGRILLSVPRWLRDRVWKPE